MVVGVAGAGLPVSQPATAEAASSESAAARKNRLVLGKLNLEILLRDQFMEGKRADKSAVAYFV